MEKLSKFQIKTGSNRAGIRVRSVRPSVGWTLVFI